MVSSATSVIFPYLRRFDIREDISPRQQQKNPLLTLKLSAPSFLDSTVNDGLSDNPLYSIQTGCSRTAVVRYDPWEGHTEIAEIRWPQRMPIKGKGKDALQGVIVQMNGSRSKAAQHFLKYGTLSGSRSFVIPNYPHTFKWRRSGSSYHCTTSSVKGPVATLDGAASSVPPRIRVYEALLVQDTRPQLDRGGVSLSLLDNLLITALLLVTDPEECVTLARPGGADEQPYSAPASVLQWRKIVYGEPLFPNLHSSKKKPVGTPEPFEDNGRLSPPVNRPASMQQMRKIVFGEPLFPSLSQSGSRGEAFSSRSSISLHGAVSESSESESMNYPSTPVSTSGPMQGHIDPSYDKTVSPIPEVPLQYHSTSPSPSFHPPSTAPTSSLSPTTAMLAHRQLPRLPIEPSSSLSPYQLTLHRSRSTPYLQSSEMVKRTTSAHGSVDSPVFLSGGQRRRLLPQPPQTSPVATTLATTSRPPLRLVVPTRLTSEKVRPRSNTQRSLPEPPGISTGRSLSEGPQEQLYVRRSADKEGNEVDWVRHLTPERHRRRQRMAAARHNAVFDAPPPAYNAIDFSRPPHASAPAASPPPPPTPPLPHTH